MNENEIPKIENKISYEEFRKVDIRVGKIIDVQEFPEARNPSYKVTIDFGKLGIKKSSAQLTDVYSKEELLGRQVLAVANFDKKQIANFMSECLITGVDSEKGVVLIQPDRKVKNGARLY